MLVAGALQASSTNLLPGVTFYDGSKKLTGKLVFLVQSNYFEDEFFVATNSFSSIYEFDLQHKKLTKIIDCPYGRMVCSHDGDSFCIIYSSGQWHQDSDTNVLVYSKSLGVNRTIHLNSSPKEMESIAGRIFFQLGDLLNHKLFDYDIANDKIRQIKFLDADKWKNEDYDLIHAPSGQPNILHFHYANDGNRVEDGKDYPRGFYSFDVQTENIKWLSNDASCKDDESYWFRSYDGNFISFAGGNNAPFDGFKLASSPWNYVGSDGIISDDKEKNIKILHKFSKLRAALTFAGEYHLIQTSPDLNFAWIKSGLGDASDYYLTDLSNGKTRILLKVDDPSKTHELIDMVRWVQ